MQHWAISPIAIAYRGSLLVRGEERATRPGLLFVRDIDEAAFKSGSGLSLVVGLSQVEC